MAKIQKCRNHPTVPTAVNCRRCGAPVCEQCRVVVGEGTFCSDLCVNEFRDFTNRVWLDGGPRTPRITLGAWIKHLGLVAVLLAVIYAALFLLTKKSNPLEIGKDLLDMVRLMF